MKTKGSVIFRRGSQEIHVPLYFSLNLLGHAQLEEIPLNSRCGGHCECGTCLVYLHKNNNINPVTPSLEEEGKLERIQKQPQVQEYLKKLPQGGTLRLACQVFPQNEDQDIIVDIPQELVTWDLRKNKNKSP